MEKELLVKYVEGNCTEKERLTVSEWIHENPDNMKEYLAIRKLTDIILWQEPGEGLIRSKSLGNSKYYKIFKQFAKVAAIFIAGALINHVFNIYRQNDENANMQTLHIPAGQRAEITLADGSRVWLNANTTLKFPSVFKKVSREVQLDGEAYFKVSADKSHPFIVKTSKCDVKVLGTEFNLLSYSESPDFETTLLKGSLQVFKRGAQDNILLRPNEKVILEKMKLRKIAVDSTVQFLWKDGILNFEKELFSEMAKKLELYFDLKIIIKNKDILKYQCTGKFRTKDGVEHILKVLRLSNKFDYTFNEKRNLILIE